MWNFSIRKQLTLAFSFIVIMILVIGGIAIKGNMMLADISTQISESALPGARYAATLRGDMIDVRLSILAHQLLSTDQDYDNEEALLKKKFKQVDDTAKIYQTYIASADETETFDIFGRSWHDFAQWTGDIIAASRAGDKKKALVLDRMTVTPLLDAANEATAKLVKFTADRAQSLQSQAADIRQMTLIVVASALGVMVVVAAGLAFAIRRSVSAGIASIVRPMSRLASGDLSVDIPHLGKATEIGAIADALGIFKERLTERLRLEADASAMHVTVDRKLKETQSAFETAGREQQRIVESLAGALTRLASGDLSVRLKGKTAPEYENLTSDFNRAMDNLERAMVAINDASEGVDAGSRDIVDASDDMARRAEEQAAGLKETASALDEITATVHREAERAKQTREIVAQTLSDTGQSSQVVKHAVQAMDEIERSAQQINQIIGVIDEIAFQTNLLALNAGVEAARAGDAGRGFAVVASEVRGLAQRSADAAKEIKALLTASTRQVGQGVALVGETGLALTRIATKVEEINRAIVEIATSAQDQQVTIQQISAAVNQIDQVTQRNAAMAQESTAASHALSKDAATLARLTAQFKVAPSSGAPRAGTPARENGATHRHAA